MPSQIILWSQGRTACHLLERMLSKQPNTDYLWHPVHTARPLQMECWRQDALAAGIPDKLNGRFVDKAQEGILAWEKALQYAQAENQTLFVHEHPQFGLTRDRALLFSQAWNIPFQAPARNFTLFPDTLILHPNTVPIFTVRHPALLCPAIWRSLATMEKSISPTDYTNFLVIAPLRWQRELFDYSLDHGVEGVIAEAEDYMTDPELVRKLCRRAGLDPGAAIFEWDRVSGDQEEKLTEVQKVLLRSLNQSTGLDREKVVSMGTMEEEREKWRVEFGEQIAGVLGEYVEACMNDYEYLAARKVRV